MIGGTCDPRFAAVREAFAENFARRGELGAAVCVTVGGRTVADLWGGTARGGRRWGPDTLVNVFSVGKGLSALVAARLFEEGRLDPDDPVVRHWPGFTAREATVRHVLSHRAGLPALRRRMPPGAMLDWDAMTAALAEQEPWWPPGTAHGYHVNTFGFLLGEVVRRATGRTIGALLREKIAGPLGADVHIGLPAAEHRRVADFHWPGDPPEDDRSSDLDDAALMRHNAYFNPGGLSGLGAVNTAAWRAAELPSTNAHATARGVARVYTALAAGGALDGVRVVDAGTLAAVTAEQASGDDLVLLRPSRFGLGFQLTQPERPLGPNPRSFGHFGAAGSLGFCDPDAEVGFGYVTNQMSMGWQNPRNRALIDALYSCL
ncbi:esterase [Actinomadura rubrobrunea]|uniref:Esterase n=2 Tax=Actinomadura rubrobrunea TaxID=115335 RepID=A0A9W6PUY2_9ACTN|nr:esterase [Actinomadura rubrobrunea]